MIFCDPGFFRFPLFNRLGDLKISSSKHFDFGDGYVTSIPSTSTDYIAKFQKLI